MSDPRAFPTPAGSYQRVLVEVQFREGEVGAYRCKEAVVDRNSRYLHLTEVACFDESRTVNRYANLYLVLDALAFWSKEADRG